MTRHLTHTLDAWKYELLLGALFVHLYVGIFVADLRFYESILWPVNMVVIGLASVGIFLGAARETQVIYGLSATLAIAFPIGLPFLGGIPGYMMWLSGFYCVFFGLLLVEVLRHLVKPSYIDSDIISASICGYLLLVEISTFLLQAFVYSQGEIISNIDLSSPAATYMDLVYFSSIAITSIGFGDMAPTTHTVRLIVSVFGIVSQFYAVVLVGILISKFTARPDA